MDCEECKSAAGKPVVASEAGCLLTVDENPGVSVEAHMATKSWDVVLYLGLTAQSMQLCSPIAAGSGRAGFQPAILSDIAMYFSLPRLLRGSQRPPTEYNPIDR